MGLLDDFPEIIDDVAVYSLSPAVGAWGTTEKEYGATPRAIKGFVQSVSGSAVFRNQARAVETTHTLYISASVTLNDTDKIVYGGETFFITDNQSNGVGGINDHKEIGLKRE